MDHHIQDIGYIVRQNDLGDLAASGHIIVLTQTGGRAGRLAETEGHRITEAPHMPETAAGIPLYDRTAVDAIAEAFSIYGNTERVQRISGNNHIRHGFIPLPPQKLLAVTTYDRRLSVGEVSICMAGDKPVPVRIGGNLRSWSGRNPLYRHSVRIDSQRASYLVRFTFPVMILRIFKSCQEAMFRPGRAGQRAGPYSFRIGMRAFTHLFQSARERRHRYGSKRQQSSFPHMFFRQRKPKTRRCRNPFVTESGIFVTFFFFL